MYTLFGFNGSGSAAIECALEMTGAPFRLVQAASWDPHSALDELERLNPLKQIPTLQLPTGQVLTESAAILIHLGLTFPQSGLLSSEPAERDQTIRGLVYIAANCYACITVVDYPQHFTSATDAASSNAVREAATARLHRLWEIFADLNPVKTANFIGGNQPGALDLLAAVVSKWSGTRQHLQRTRPAFFELLERIDADPTVALVFGRHWPGATDVPTGV